MFLHTRIYGGYAPFRSLNPEPFAYEYGLATKWFVHAQIAQLRTGVVDPIAGDLSLDVAPWMGWGPYFWAAGSIPRKGGLTWMPTDVRPDLTHAGSNGASKVTQMMLDFYLNSPYGPWFRRN